MLDSQNKETLSNVTGSVFMISGAIGMMIPLFMCYISFFLLKQTIEKTNCCWECDFTLAFLPTQCVKHTENGMGCINYCTLFKRPNTGM